MFWKKLFAVLAIRLSLESMGGIWLNLGVCHFRKKMWLLTWLLCGKYFWCKKRTRFSPWSITYLWGSLCVSVCFVYPGRNIPRSPLKIVMDFGQSMTTLQLSIQCAWNRAPLGQYLEPREIGVWLIPCPAWVSSVLCWLFPLGFCLMSLWGTCSPAAGTQGSSSFSAAEWTIVASLTSRWLCVPPNFTFIPMGQLAFLPTQDTVKTSKPKQWLCT